MTPLNIAVYLLLALLGMGLVYVAMVVLSLIYIIEEERFEGL